MLFLGILLTGALNAQGIRVTGKVTDAADGSAMVGVTLREKGTTNGTTTDANGTFSLTVSPNATLVISYVGYLTQEIPVNNRTTINIVLSVNVQAMQEVVVIGYGTVKKSDATGSVVAVSSKDFNKGAITTAQELLIGKSAGVVISTNSGAPGAASTIRIRGGSSFSASNAPLIVVDNVPLDNTGISGVGNIFSSINPNDIESFTVLKDASATAIYGSRASNGVIIITTKRGKAGQPFEISYNGSFAVSTNVKSLDLLSGDEFRQLAINKVGSNNITASALTHLGTANTNWQKQIYQLAYTNDHNINVTGSAKNMPYRASFGYSDQKGILANTGYKRSTLNFGLDPSFLDDHLQITINGKGSYENSNFGETGAVGSAVRFDPSQTVMNGNTRYSGYTTWTMNWLPNGEYNQMATANPLAQVDLTNNQSYVYRGIGNAQIDYKFHFLPDLHANLNVGIDIYKSNGINNADTTAMWTRRAGFGRLTDYSQHGSNKLLDFTLHYVKNLDAIKSKVDVMGGYSWQHFWRKGDNYQRSIVDAKHALIIADSSNYATENFLVSFFGRLNYTLLDRYLVTFTIRDDGSSRFSKTNRWGLFPSVALAWKINEEPFMKDIKAITDLKVRLGWGQTGQQNISNDDYPYLGTYRISQSTAYYQFGNEWIPTLRPNAYDPNIKWETTTTKNIGLDFGFLNGLISGSFDYYDRVTTDLISNIAIPNGSNFSNYLTTNVGSLENKGYEVSLELRPVSTKDISWSIGFNLSYNKNKITKLLRTDDPTYIGIQSGGVGGGTGNNILITSVGYPTYSFFALQQVYDSENMPIEGLYVDRSGNGGTVSGNLLNFYHYKKPAPDYLMGISSRFNYKNIDFAFSGRISIGNYLYNNIASQAFYGNLYNNNYWQNLPKYINDTQFNNSQQFSDIFIENASFFKMDNISLGYSFDKLLNDKLNGRVSFTVQNAFVITKYTGIDPEVNGGIDNNIYPRPRTFLLGLNLNF
jgi:iron complex outermembrane receptor protein